MVHMLIQKGERDHTGGEGERVKRKTGSRVMRVLAKNWGEWGDDTSREEITSI
jgi:hypothetical protein